MHKRFWAAMIATASLIALVACSSNDERSGGNVQNAERIAAEGRATGPLPDGAFKASITLANPPAMMRPGQKETLYVKVKNLGTTTWPAHGRANDGYFQVNLGDIWYDNKNERVVKHPYVRSGLPNDLAAGQEFEVPLNITAPTTPGDYTLQIDLVQEMVAWFGDKGSPTPTFKIKITG